MGPISCPETSVRNYHCTIYKITEEIADFNMIAATVAKGKRAGVVDFAKQLSL
jgi:hypothetical protein